MIELHQAGKAYGPTPGRGRPVVALEEMTLRIPTGTTWAVVGPNGAGKTTLFALILGFLHPTTGRVRIEGLAPRAYIRRHGAAFLPERFQLPGEWSITATLRALARLERHRGAAARKRVEEAVERFGLARHAHKPLATLSRGLLQRVGLAQTLLSDSRLVVLDEPTEGLDPLWRVQFRDLITELHRDGRTILIASHDLAEVERIAEQAVLLEAGKMREVIPIQRPEKGARRYHIELARPAPAFMEIFPGAMADQEAAVVAGASALTSRAQESLPVAAIRHAEPNATPNATPDAAPDVAPVRYLVEVADHDELSARLGALLATGATIIAVQPDTTPLEQRVQQALAPN